jgi:hypothetical protein
MIGLRYAAYALLAAPLVFCGPGSADQMPPLAQAALEKTDTFELLSLDPDPEKKTRKDGFHGWKVLGQTLIKDAKVRKDLVAAFKKGVEENDGIVADCFIPRHGIRIKHEGKTVDLVICFQCLKVYLYVDGKREKGFLVTRSPQPLFNQVLKSAGVPLPKGPED